MVLALLLLSVFSIFLFPNTIYFSLNLLLVVFMTLSFMFYAGMLSSLSVLMLLIVYVGAIIILIGYVCAVCPNVNFTTSSNNSLLILLTPLFVLISPAQFLIGTPNCHSFNFFFTSLGLPIFIVVVFMLFVILLIVTSYYISPNGPFRSVS